MIAELFGIIAPVLISVAIGYVWAKQKHAWDTEFITRLTYYIGTPFLVFSILTKTGLDTRAFSEMAGAALLALVGFIVASLPVLLLFRLPVRTY